jgi:hypothetical protein
VSRKRAISCIKYTDGRRTGLVTKEMPSKNIEEKDRENIDLRGRRRRTPSRYWITLSKSVDIGN